MFNTNTAILILIALIFFISCGNDPTSAKAEETVTDIDGNVYKVKKIGDQWWMTENLKVTRYRNGDAIPNVLANNQWVNLTSGAYCDLSNNPDNAGTFGRLYNWHAVVDQRQIAPEGWHVPQKADWEKLIEYLGGAAVAGGKMKQSGTEYWNGPNYGATNESGFTALPVGVRSNSGYYIEFGYNAYFWASSESGLSGFALNLSYGHAKTLLGGHDKQLGYSVRCVRD